MAQDYWPTVSLRGGQVGWEIFAGHLDFIARLRMSSHSAYFSLLDGSHQPFLPAQASCRLSEKYFLLFELKDFSYLIDANFSDPKMVAALQSIRAVDCKSD